MEENWYDKGVRFACTGCGKCCTGKGSVFLNEAEIEQLASFLHLSKAAFMLKYVRRKEGQLALVDAPSSDGCVFLKGKQCSVYEARPTQCRTFPFWPEHLRSRKHWESLKNCCEGIHEEATIVDKESIEKEKLIQIKRRCN